MSHPFSKTSYLPPQARVLKSHQVGLSNHVNSYTSGTLCSNWIEERNAYETKPTDRKLSTETETRQNYVNPNTYARRDLIMARETDRETLFAHGIKEPKNQFVSSNDLMYTKAGTKQFNCRTDQLFTPSEEPECDQRRTLLEKKQAEWNKDLMREKKDLRFELTSQQVGHCVQGIQTKHVSTKRWGSLTKGVMNADRWVDQLR